MTTFALRRTIAPQADSEPGDDETLARRSLDRPRESSAEPDFHRHPARDEQRYARPGPTDEQRADPDSDGVPGVVSNGSSAIGAN
jgi:hypothetical protein